MFEYCHICQDYPSENIHRIHHDTVYGLAVDDDDELFGKLILEINQAGLSWTTILHKEDNFRSAYSNFEIKRIAIYNEQDRIRLLSDSGIIRNRLKIDAIIYNAMIVLEIQREFGSFFQWLKIQTCLNKMEWVRLFKSRFKFIGGEIVNEFLMTIGRIDGAHMEDCHRYETYIAIQNKWK